VYVIITKEQTALIAVVFLVAFASTLSKSFRDGDRRNNIRLLGLGFTSGFFAIGFYCIGFDYINRIFGAGANLFWIGFASFIGFTAHLQDQIGSNAFRVIANKLLGRVVVVLSSLIKKDDK